MNPKTIHVKPAPGRCVLHPLSDRKLGNDSIAVSDSPLWRKRIRDGDVIVTAGADVQRDRIEVEIFTHEPAPESSTKSKSKN